MKTSRSIQNAIALFREQGGILRTGEALRLGIHPRTLYAMRDSGVLEQLSRGLYRLAELPPLSNPDLVTVALKVPQAVICLVSALAFHELTTQIPHFVDIALPNRAERPRLDYSPLRIFWFSGPAWSEGFRPTGWTMSPCASAARRRISPIASSTGTSSGWTSPWKPSSSIASGTTLMSPSCCITAASAGSRG